MQLLGDCNRGGARQTFGSQLLTRQTRKKFGHLREKATELFNGTPAGRNSKFRSSLKGGGDIFFFFVGSKEVQILAKSNTFDQEGKVASLYRLLKGDIFFFFLG